MISIDKFSPADREQWETLFTAYNEFYERTLPPQMFDRAWQAFQVDTKMHAFGAKLDGELVGIVHFFTHVSTTASDVCYIQDLFTAPSARGKGVARALIDEVTAWAKSRECSSIYWTTKEDNTVARRLYDKLAENPGFIVYRVEL